MTVRILMLGAVLTAALAGMAAATVVNESGPPVGAKSGGAASLVPGGADQMVMLVNPSPETTCLLQEERKGGE